jgi:hypothetical protein
MKIREVFEYEVDTDDMNEVFTIKDYVECVDDMTCPFWDGMIAPDIINHDLEIIEQ